MVSVLYISYDGMTDPLGQSQVIPYLKELTKVGFSFTILSCEKKEKFVLHKGLILKVLEESSIKWEPIFYTKNPPVLSTIYDFYRLKEKAYALHKKTPFAIVHCRSYISSLIGLDMKLKLNLQFIFDMRGFWADERIDGSLWNLRNPLYKIIYDFFKRAERDFLKHADAIISLTFSGKAEMLTWPSFNRSHEIIKVIPCCADTFLFNPANILPEQKQNLMQQLNIRNDDFVLAYLGSIGTWYMLDEMLDFFKSLQSHVIHSKFLFITFDKHEYILEKAASRNIDLNDIIIYAAERSNVPLVLSLATYSIFFILPAYSKMSSSPTKQGEIMAMGVPVICNAGVGDTDQIVEKYSAGLIVKSFDYDEILAKIKNFKPDPISIREGALDYFSLAGGSEKYAEVYSSLMLKRALDKQVS